MLEKNSGRRKLFFLTILHFKNKGELLIEVPAMTKNKSEETLICICLNAISVICFKTHGLTNVSCI